MKGARRIITRERRIRERATAGERSECIGATSGNGADAIKARKKKFKAHYISGPPPCKHGNFAGVLFVEEKNFEHRPGECGPTGEGRSRGGVPNRCLIFPNNFLAG